MVDTHANITQGNFLQAGGFQRKEKYMTLDMKFGNWEKYITENKILRTKY